MCDCKVSNTLRTWVWMCDCKVFNILRAWVWMCDCKVFNILRAWVVLHEGEELLVCTTLWIQQYKIKVHEATC